jgi:hypothetical protein
MQGESGRNVILSYGARAGRMKLIQHTIYKSQSFEVETVQGNIKYRAWCEGECERMIEHGRQAELRFNDRGEVSIWVNDIVER